MRPYETLVVLRTDAVEEGTKLFARLESVITGDGGRIDENRDWGIRNLAYPIGKQKQGHYYLLEYHAAAQTVKEVERTLRITEGVMRFVSVQQEHTGLPEPRVREQYDRREAPLSDMRSADAEVGGGAEVAMDEAVEATEVQG